MYVYIHRIATIIATQTWTHAVDSGTVLSSLHTRSCNVCSFGLMDAVAATALSFLPQHILVLSFKILQQRFVFLMGVIKIGWGAVFQNYYNSTFVALASSINNGYGK